MEEGGDGIHFIALVTPTGRKEITPNISIPNDRGQATIEAAMLWEFLQNGGSSGKKFGR